MTSLNIVACGDSIMWGQGIETRHKFVTLVKNEMEKQTGKKARLKLFAHSGATIDADDSKRGFWDNYCTTPAPADSPYEGEIARTFPTVLEQLDMLSDAEAKGVDVLLLDGGANDLNFSDYLLDKNLLSESNKNTVKGIAYDLVFSLLKQARVKFSNAKIYYLGTYAPLSGKSKFSDALDRLVTLKGIESGIWTTSVAKTGGDIATFISNEVGEYLFPFGKPQRSESSQVKQAKKEFPLGQRIFTSYCMQAIEDFNASHGKSRPVVFVHPEFKSKNAAHAKRKDALVAEWGKMESMPVWKARMEIVTKALKDVEVSIQIPWLDKTITTTVDPTLLINAADPEFEWVPDPDSERSKELTAFRHMHFMHPNIAGAKKIADQIMTADPSLQRVVSTGANPEKSLRKALDSQGGPVFGLRAASMAARSAFVRVEFASPVDVPQMIDRFRFVYVCSAQYNSKAQPSKGHVRIAANTIDLGHVDFCMLRKENVSAMNGMSVVLRYTDDYPDIKRITVFLNGKRFFDAKDPSVFKERDITPPTNENQNGITSAFAKKVRVIQRRFTLDFNKHRDLICYD